MEEDEMEKFEISDYDIQNEFTGARRYNKLSKEQQIYGMWANNSDGEEVEIDNHTAGLRSKFKNQGMNFVTGGIQQDGKKQLPLAEDDSIPTLGIAYNSSDEEEQIFRPSFKESKKPLSTGNRKGRGVIAGMRGHGGSKEGGVGDWEKHTTGIGSKLMRMMGYEEGKGLGKNLQGRAIPVEAQKRKGKGAIGFYGQEITRKPEVVESDEENSKFEEQLQQWRKGGGRKKVKYVYKSAEEAIQDGKSKIFRSSSDNHITKTKVIDMTGPETRILSSYHAIGGQKTILDEYEDTNNKKYEHFDLPELVYNLQLLVEKSEEDIVQNAKTLEREENRIVHLSHERKKYETLLEREESDLQTMNEALVLVEDLEANHSNNDLSLDQAYLIMAELKTTYTNIYYSFQLPYMATTYVIPLFKELFSNWSPLEEPTVHLETMAGWQTLIEMDASKLLHTQPSLDEQMDPYQSVMWETWVPVVRSTIMNNWVAKDCKSLLSVMDNWAPPLMPLWIQAHILQTVLLPKITLAVHSWNPMEDTVPIHTWLHPWLPLMADHLQAVYPVIRQKLSSALIHWHPSDRSAKMVLQPWKRVFSDISMTNLIQCSIQSKLESALMEMPISPHNQKLDAWHWFCDWQDLLPIPIMLDILEKCFFPRWYQSLGSWLYSNPSYTDVIAWYKGWRDLMPAKASSHLQVKQKFQQSLEICRRTLSFQPGASEQFTLLLSGLEKITEPPPPPPAGSPPKKRSKDWENIISDARKSRKADQTYKDYIDQKCQEKGILFMPIPDRMYEGRPVYRCGKMNVSFLKNEIFSHTPKGMVPTSIKSLLEESS